MTDSDEQELKNINQILANIYQKDNPIYPAYKEALEKETAGMGSRDENGVPKPGRFDW